MIPLLLDMATVSEGNLQGLVQQSGRQLGIATLTGDQERAVCEFARGHDVFVCLPTGSGKSFCFALLPLVLDLIRGTPGSICLVVSPIIGTAGKRHARRDTGWTISVSLYNTRSSRRQCLAQKYANGECVAGKLGGLCHRRSTLHQDLVRQ